MRRPALACLLLLCVAALGVHAAPSLGLPIVTDFTENRRTDWSL